jgi:hypothetical protein
VVPEGQFTVSLQLLSPAGQHSGWQVSPCPAMMQTLPGKQSVHLVQAPPLAVVPAAWQLQTASPVLVSCDTSQFSFAGQPQRGEGLQELAGVVLGYTQHAPWAQRLGDVEHLCPHAPQLFGSAVVLMHVPAQQLSPVVQACPHAPQLFESVCTFTHVGGAGVEQSVGADAGQVQVPETQVAFDAHAFPHAPQLAASVCVFVHSVGFAVGHMVGLVDGHAHAPALQTPFFRQAVPHFPQFAASDWVFVHSVEQVSGFAGVHEQLPPLQTPLVKHARPQVPQLLVSVSTFVHLPPQTGSSDTPSDGQWQTPLTQVCTSTQASLHFPQLDLSFCRLTQVDPHCVSPELQRQAPLEQLMSVEHALPQLPQLARSVVVSTHAPPQHCFVPGHAAPHAPQLAGSRDVSMHVPLQSVCPP